jgi:DNA (cytosine-5)-methyltransferase 1
MTAYYNEIDPYAAQWLRNLIAAGHIAPGYVDERSIVDVKSEDLRGYTQCHFFAGIGVWSHALRLSKWADDRRVWTGSCPCQPFSNAGKGEGFNDERHLWPHFERLIRECRPSVVFGEQVASKDAEPWIDLVQTDLEALGYAFGAIPFPSASVGAPHIRDRLYWVGDADNERSQEHRRHGELHLRQPDRPNQGRLDFNASVAGGLADSDSSRWESRQRDDQTTRHGDSSSTTGCDDRHESTGPTNGFWRAPDWLFCRDGKWRPVRSGSFPLVNGATGRVGRLRAYGNAINAKAAQAFIESYLEATK